jgi:gliding motility-associatede transport system auxiliary component
VRKQRIVLTSATALSIVLVAALVLMANWLGYRHYERGDWTKAKIYTLSGKSLNVLKGIDADVHVVVFMTPQTPLFNEVKELLERYQAASKHISVEFIDPDRNPLRTQQLAKEYGISAANTVVFTSADRKKYVTSDQLAEYDYSGLQMGQGPRLTGFKGEEQFTSAILGVVNAKQPKVYFTTGHGEHDPDDTSEAGMSKLSEELKRDNMKVAKVSLLTGKVPEDCDVLVVAGPTAPFADNEKSAVATYLDGGGRVLLMLDPVLGGRMRPSGLEALASEHGAMLGDDLVVDPERRVPFIGLESVYVNDFRSHPVVDGMKGLAVLLPVARSVTTRAVKGVKDTQLFTTSAGGWGETDLRPQGGQIKVSKDAKDTPGPVSMAVAAEPDGTKAKPWRLLVVGDSDFATNATIQSLGNLTLALNAVNWLAKQEASLGIPPRKPEQVQLFLSASQMRTIALISLLGLPGAAIVLGVAVWWRRRR